MLVESGTYNQEFTRPYTSHMDQNTLNLYTENTQMGQHVNRGTLAGIAGSIVSPSSVVDAQVNVINGWGERRIIFMMEIQEVHTKLIAVIMGYADKVDLSYQTGIIDPELRMTFNSTMTLSSVEHSTPNGWVTRKRVVDNAHMMGAQTISALVPVNPAYNHDAGRIYTQRPQDVAFNLSLQDMPSGVIFDGRTQLMPNKQIRSKRENNSATHYLSQVINNISQTTNAVEVQDGHMSNQDVYNLAGATMQELTIQHDPVLRYIAKNSNMNNLGFVTWGQMCAMFPDLDSQSKFYTRSQDVMKMETHFESTAGTFADWNTVGWEPILATTVLHTLPSLISQCMLMGISGTMTNNTIDGGYAVSIEDARAFVDGFDRTQAVQHIEYRLLTEVLPGLTQNNQRNIFVAFNINLVRDGWVSISIDGQHAVEFSSPCFADGLLLPTVATNQDSLSNLATTINTLVSIAQ